MPLLSPEQNAELLQRAKEGRDWPQAGSLCRACQHYCVKDYCRSCDEFYFIHANGCEEHAYDCDHDGHRTVLRPFVEVR